MRSRWYRLKEKAIYLRKHGYSISRIEREYGIARSTLSSWFKGITLTESQKNKLLQNKHKALFFSRKKAVLWHNKQKQKRIDIAQSQAIDTLKHVDTGDIHIIELALAILYLGEGNKKTVDTSLGNSDPLILNFFIKSLKKIYNISYKNIRCELYLRADQDPEKIKKYWAKELKLPLSNFRQINIDKRTQGSKTYANYKGVCALRCGNVSIQRRLMFIADLFCKEVINKMGL